MSVDIRNTSVQYQFDLSDCDGGLIAIMLQDSPNISPLHFLGVPVDVVQEPFTMFGAIYPSYVVNIDLEELSETKFTVEDVVEGFLVYIQQMITRAKRYAPDEINVYGYWHHQYYLQRKAVLSYK